MNLPNKLTVSRLLLTPFLLFFLSFSFPLAKSAALLVFIVAGITDYYDGYLARTRYGTSRFGALVDPLADKILVCAAFVSFVELQLLSATIVVIIIAREFLVTGLRLLAANEGKIISAGFWGKHKTFWQMVTIIIVLSGLAIRYDWLDHASSETLISFDHAFKIVSYLTGGAVAIITVISGFVYFLENRDVIRYN